MSVSVGFIKNFLPCILKFAAGSGPTLQTGYTFLRRALSVQSNRVDQFGRKNVESVRTVGKQKTSGPPYVKVALGQAAGQKQAGDVEGIGRGSIQTGECGIVVHRREQRRFRRPGGR